MADFRPYAIRGETRPAAVRAGGRPSARVWARRRPGALPPRPPAGPRTVSAQPPRGPAGPAPSAPGLPGRMRPRLGTGASPASASPGRLRTREGPLCRGVEARRADAPLRRGPPHRVSGPAATEPPAPPPGRAVALLRTCSAAHSVWLFKVTLNLKGIKSTFSGQTRNVPLVTENSVGPMGDVGAREAVMGVCLLRPVTE